MPDRLRALVLSVLLASPAHSARQPLETLNAIPPDTLVELRLRTGERVRGWIGAVESNTVQLRLGRETLQTRRIPVNEVKSVKRVNSPEPRHTGRNILLGVVIAVSLIAAGVLLAASKLDYI